MLSERESSSEAVDVEAPTSEHTLVQAIPQRRRITVEALEYHLFRPRRAHDPLLERAYEVWREGWRDTLFELEGSTELHSDEFGRQDEVAVFAVQQQCVAITGLRWLDLALPRSREDSYFKHWPGEALQKVDGRLACVASNTVVHPAWRGTQVLAPEGVAEDPARLAFVTIALSVRRFLASSAECLIALTRNDRSIDRIAAALGATRLAQIRLHGIETDVICIDRANATPRGAVVSELWRRRHHP